MKQLKDSRAPRLSLCLLLCLLCAAPPAPARQAGKNRTPAKKPAAKQAAGATANRPSATAKAAPSPKPAALTDEEFKAKLDAAFKLAPAESVKELESLVKTNARSSLLPRALELLTAARASLGDERLRAGDVEGGVALFRRAVDESPAQLPDKLFYEVVSQLPAHLFLRGQQRAAFDLARAVEERVKADPKRLVALAGFYLSVEQPEEAARLASSALALAPESAPAHLALAASHRIALRLDEAAESYKRALELDPKSAVARRSLADLGRASGRAEEALALYRELLAADPRDAGARAGLVLSLFDAGQREEAERELEAALAESPSNLPLLVGAAWWYASKGDARRAEELAARAVSAEPRYTWAQIVLARSLVAQKRVVEAERALRVAHQYGRFPTLDYELASVLAAAGLYEEAAEELARSFTLDKDGQLETRLAGRMPARADSFTELLAPERRASIFQHAAADTEANARTLKNLLAFHLLMNKAGGSEVYAKDSGAAEAAAFASGDDEMVAFRQLYAAGRLLKHGFGLTEAQRLVESAMSHVERALGVPHANLALMADELRAARERARASGSVANFPEVPRNTLSNIMRGRIEDTAGWSLFIEGKAPEAVVRLKRAASVLPEGSPWWRAAQWHLGAALDAAGSQQEALAAYVRSYNSQAPDPARRAIIEGLYRRVHGSLEGLDDKIGRAPAAALVAGNTPPAPPADTTTTAATATTTNAAPEPTTTAPATSPAVASTPAVTPATTDAPVSSPTTSATPEQKAETPSVIVETPSVIKPETPAVTSPPVNTPAVRIERTPEPSAQPATTGTPEPATSTPTSTPPPTAEPEANKAEGAAKKESETRNEGEAKAEGETSARTRPRQRAVLRVGGASGADCALSLSEDALTVRPGATASVTVTLGEGGDLTTVKATTANWSDIMVMAGTTLGLYNVSSISKKEGTYAVNFTAPCGTKTLTVNVK